MDTFHQRETFHTHRTWEPGRPALAFALPFPFSSLPFSSVVLGIEHRVFKHAKLALYHLAPYISRSMFAFMLTSLMKQFTHVFKEASHRCHGVILGINQNIQLWCLVIFLCWRQGLALYSWLSLLQWQNAWQKQLKEGWFTSAHSLRCARSRSRGEC